MNRRLLLLAVVLLAAGCRRAETGPAAPEPAPVSVQTALVASESLPALIDVPATVRPVERAVISAKLTGTIATLPWGLGQEVRTGDILITLAAPETEARVRQAQAQLAEAERTAERERILVTKGVNAPDTLRGAEDRLRFAQAGLAEVEAMLAHATIRAPFAGVVTEKQVLPGDLATPGLPLLALESTARLRAEGTVPEQTATTLRLGSQITVMLSDTSPAVEGVIEELSAAADAVSRSILVKVALPPGTARSGQFARLRVIIGRTDTLLVPAGAVTHFGQMERVFVVCQGRTQLRLVKTGREEHGRIEILSGLQPGETVILSPPASLREGVPVDRAP
jgi:membrane fusion protein (multidrug efflux system)